MGVRISYSYIKDGNLEGILIKAYPVLRDLLYEWNEESLQIHSTPCYSAQVIDFLILHDELPMLNTISQEVLDALVVTPVTDFGLFIKQKPYPFKSIGAEVHPRRYIKSTELVQLYADARTNKLWNYLLVGRSLKDDAPFMSGDDHYIIGFWKPEECQYLYQSLQATFGDLQQIRARYWTPQETQQYHDAIQEANRTDSYVSLVDFNPISSGIEYVFEMLESIHELEVEVVFGTG